MPARNHTDMLYRFLTERRYRGWRHGFFILLLVPIGLSQSFFTLGNTPGLAAGTIYLFGACFSAVTLGIVYFNNYGVAPYLLPKGRYVKYFTVLLGMVLTFVVLKYLAEDLILLDAGVNRIFNGVTLLDMLSNWAVYTVCIVSASVTVLLRQWTADREVIADLSRKRLENDIDELKNRIHPEFLYATLDDAARTVRSDPAQASDTLFTLSELLKYQLYDAMRERVLLAAEITFIRQYLRLEQQNRKQAFAYTVTVEGNDHRLVPPALFSPWVEEIIRQRPSDLSVGFHVDGGTIGFTCRVTGAGLGACDFRKVEQQIALLYGDDAAIHQSTDSITLQLKRC